MVVEKIIMAAVLIFTFAVAFLSVHYALNQVTTQMLATPVINSSNATVTSIEGTEALSNRMDYVIFGLFIGLTLALIVGAFFASLHPIFMFIYFIIIILGIIVSVILSNVFHYIGNDTILNASIASFPITANILDNLPIYIAIIGFMGIVIMFAKPYVVSN